MKSKRRFSPEFKLKVVLEAIKERQTASELAIKFEIAPSQISTWKTEFLTNAEQLFSVKQTLEDPNETEKNSMLAKIGQLQLEVDF